MTRTDRSFASFVILPLASLTIGSIAFSAPLSDEDWNAIAGSRISEKYEIVKGDTLWGISQRLFGDPKYWPKIWEMNNSSIPDPHWIRPGNTIIFKPGSGNSLPEVAIQKKGDTTTLDHEGSIKNEPETPSNLKIPGAPPRSEEWKLLPRQDWEGTPVSLPPGVDSQGFDESAKVRSTVKTGFELEAVSSTQEIPILGQITASRSDGTFLTIGDTVYIRAEQTESLQIGETYAITEQPQRLKTDGRRGYSFLVNGKVKITSVKDSLFIGTILSTKFLVSRGNFLMKLPARIEHITPIAGPSSITGRVLLNKNFSSYESAQHKQVIINRGSEDGLTPGMIFRCYQRKDPVSGKSITQSNSLTDADIMVIQTSEGFSTGLVIKSLAPIEDESQVILLTDVSEYAKKTAAEIKTIENPVEPKKEDELDKLDKSNPEGLGAEEKKELKQLENWKLQPSPSPLPSPSPSGSPSPAPTLSPSATPEPTASETPPTPLPDEAPAPATEPAPAPNVEPAPPPPPPPAQAPTPDQLPPEPEIEIPPA